MRHTDHRIADCGRWLPRLRLGLVFPLLLSLLTVLSPWAQAADAPLPPPGVPAMQNDPLNPLDTSSPSATYQSFLQQTARVQALFLTYLNHKSLSGEQELVVSARRTGRLFDLSGVAPALRSQGGASATMYLADILNRLPEIPPDTIPGAGGRAGAKLPDQWRIPGTEITIARVETGPHKGEYLFTADSVDQLAADHALMQKLPVLRPTRSSNWRQVQVNITGPLIPDGLVRRLPEWTLAPVLGTPVWKIVATFLLFVLVLCLMTAWALVARRMGKNHGRFRRAAVAFAVPVGLLLIYVVCVIFVRTQLNLSGAFSALESFVSVVVLYLIAAWGAWTLCFLLAEAIIAAPSIPENSYDSHLLRLCARLAGFATVAGLLLYGANQIGIPALGLVAGLGVGGIAVALASQSTVENLIGGFSIFADRPFRVGDFIRHGDKSGWVESIGPRSSRIRELDGALTTMPNGDLARMHITNYSMRSKCLFQHEVGLRYETSPEQCEWLIAALRGFLADHALVEKAPGFPRVAFTGFGNSAITLALQANIMTTDYAAFLEVQETLLLGIMRLVSEAGTGFAFPSQTAYLARDGGIDRTIQARIAAERAGHAVPEPSEPG